MSQTIFFKLPAREKGSYSKSWPYKFPLISNTSLSEKQRFALPKIVLWYLAIRFNGNLNILLA